MVDPDIYQQQILLALPVVLAEGRHLDRAHEVVLQHNHYNQVVLALMDLDLLVVHTLQVLVDMLHLVEVVLVVLVLEVVEVFQVVEMVDQVNLILFQDLLSLMLVVAVLQFMLLLDPLRLGMV